ncbi:hypothetical protein BDW68DRAFT_162450 [Aspergillus falconensis]
MLATAAYSNPAIGEIQTANTANSLLSQQRVRQDLKTYPPLHPIMATLGMSVLTGFPYSEGTAQKRGLSWHPLAPVEPVSKAQSTESYLSSSADTSTHPRRKISSSRSQLMLPDKASTILVKRTISEDCTQSGPSDRSRKYYCLQKDAERWKRLYHDLPEKPCAPARMLMTTSASNGDREALPTNNTVKPPPHGGHPSLQQLSYPQSRAPNLWFSNSSTKIYNHKGKRIAKRLPQYSRKFPALHPAAA